MHAFSRSLIDLYDLAEQARLDEFPAEALRFLRKWVAFDGAVLGMGETAAAPQSDLQITQAHVQGRDSSILQAYGEVSASDPVTQSFLKGLTLPLAVDCQALYGARDQAGLNEFSRRYALRHLMLFGDHPTETHSGRWLVLYRGEDRGFDAPDVQYLHAAWCHLSRALGINRKALLDRQAPPHLQRAAALVNGQGRIEATDRYFRSLLQTEWADFQGQDLPRSLRDCVASRTAYRGRHIEVHVCQQGGVTICTAQAVKAVSLLTPGENAVARRFAAGMSAKDIARELGVSPHTVRSQINHLYAKLHVHDKAALAQHFMARADFAP